MYTGQKGGFTMIELMIVVAIIGVLAAIAVPSMLRARISGNQTAAKGTMHTLVQTEGMFRQNDDDRNGVDDYWVLDMWGLYGIHNAGGDPIRLISKKLGHSDYEESAVGGYPAGIGVETFPGAGASADKGYYYGTYNAFVISGGGIQNYDEGNGRNTDRYAFVGFPQLYDNTGLKAFHVCEDGTIFWRDASAVTGPQNRAFNDANTGDPITPKGTLPITQKPMEPSTNGWTPHK